MFRAVELLTKDLSGMSSAAGSPIRGIIGVDILTSFQITLSFQGQHALLESRRSTRRTDSPIPLTHFGAAYLVPVSVHGETLRFLLDTGTNLSELSENGWAKVSSNMRRRRVEGILSSAGNAPASLSCIDEMQLGRSSLKSVPIRIAPAESDGFLRDTLVDGTLDLDILSRFRVVIDLQSAQLFLEARGSFDNSSQRFTTIGVQFVPSRNRHFLIVSVWNPSPAWSAGLKQGAEILAVNRVSTEGLTVQEFTRRIHGPVGTAVKLTVQGREGVEEVDVRLQDLACGATTTEVQ